MQRTASCSPAPRQYFEKLFESACRDAPVLKDELPAAAFEPLLEFLYEGSVAVPEDLILPLLHAADYLGVETLKQAAAGALRGAGRFAGGGAARAGGGAGGGRSSHGEQRGRRLQHGCTRRRGAAAGGGGAAQLLALLRHLFPVMARDFLEQTVGKWPPLESFLGQKLLFEAMLSGNFGTAARPRLGFGGRHLYLVGGRETLGGADLASVDVYDVQAKTWTAGAPMNEARMSPAAAVLSGKLYVLGGCGKASVEAFDWQSGKWAAAWHL